MSNLEMPTARCHWTTRETDRTIEMYRAGATCHEISAVLPLRSPVAVEVRIRILRKQGVDLPDPPRTNGAPFSLEEEERILAMKAAGYSCACIAEVCRRSEGAIRSKINMMLLQRSPIPDAESAREPQPIDLGEEPPVARVLKPSKPGRIVRPIPDAAERNKRIADHAKAKRYLPPDWRSPPRLSPASMTCRARRPRDDHEGFGVIDPEDESDRNDGWYPPSKQDRAHNEALLWCGIVAIAALIGAALT
jgi:hypothetical protein